jgi:hypothetical protein
MLNEDQYLDRTPDLVAKVRKMREAAEKQMNRFTCLADYDVRRVVGHGPKPATFPPETAAAPSASERPKKTAAKSAPTQTVLEFTPTPAEESGDEENA